MLNKRFTGPTQSVPPKRHLDRFSRFAGLTDTDTHTHTHSDKTQITELATYVACDACDAA